MVRLPVINLSPSQYKTMFPVGRPSYFNDNMVPCICKTPTENGHLIDEAFLNVTWLSRLSHVFCDVTFMCRILIRKRQNIFYWKKC